MGFPADCSFGIPASSFPRSGASSISRAIHSDELKAFLAKYTENNEQHGLQGPLTKFHADVKAGGSRHEAMRDALPWAFRESIIGRYSAQFAYESLKFAFVSVKSEAMLTGEFDRLAQWAAAVAELADPDETRARVDRPKDQETEYEKDVAYELHRMEVRAEAKRRFDSNARVPFSRTPMSLAELLAQPPNPTPMRIDNVMQDQALVLFAAQYKAGKTTAVDNLVRSLVDGDPFLGVFTVRETVKRLVLIDTEMSQDMVRTWLSEQKIKNTGAVADVICLRGEVASFDILDPQRRGEWAAHLREIGCDYLILDCLSPVLEALGLDENHDIGKFLIAFRALLAEAGIAGDAMIVHHMGHTGERARGDSKLPGGADAIWKIVRDNPDDESSVSYFSANGRDVEVSQGLLKYDASTRRLTYDAVSRADMQKQQREDAKNQEKVRKVKVAFGEILRILRADITEKRDKPESVGLSGHKIEVEAIKTPGVSRQAVRDALENGRKTGELAHWEGKGGGTEYTIGELLGNDDAPTSPTSPAK